MAFVMNSPAFADGHDIPQRYTRDGANVSPPLEWRDPPNGTRSYALMVDDPDAPSGTFHHWAVYNIMADRTRLPEGTTDGAKTETLGHGINDFGHPHYDGPEPPVGHGTHHYHFRLAALDVETLDLPPKAKVTDVWEAAGPHILAEAEMVGTYARGPQPERGAETVVTERGHGAPPNPATGGSGPVYRAGDAGGPGEGRGAIGTDRGRNAESPPPNRLGDTAYDRPEGGLGNTSDVDYDPSISGPDVNDRKGSRRNR